MKRISTLLMLFLLLLLAITVKAQEKELIYDISADAEQQITSAVAKAAAEGKHVLIQVGGDWCGWCIKFHHYIDDDAELKKAMGDNYIKVLLNYSRENKNEAVLEKLGNPGRLGYPVFVVLDAKGERIHTQDSGLLEEGSSYSKKKVMGFFMNWSPAAINPKKG